MKLYLSKSMVLMSDYYQLMNVTAVGSCHCWKAGKTWLTLGSGCHLLWV